MKFEINFEAIIQLKEEFPSMNLDFIRQGMTKPLVKNFNQVPPLEKLLETTSDSFFENKEVNGHGKKIKLLDEIAS